MKHMLLITNNEFEARSLRRNLTIVHGFLHCQISEISISLLAIEYDHRQSTYHTDLLVLYDRLFSWIDSILTQFSSDSVLLAFSSLWGYDETDLHSLNPLSVSDAGRGKITAMLMLAFPEVHWLMLGKSNDKLFCDVHIVNGDELFREALRLSSEGFCPLFDATGLREKIKRCIRKYKFTSSSYIPKRSRISVAMDEERSYALFNSYVAFRFGYRSHVITTYSMAKRLLSDEKYIKRVSLAFEDCFLNFRDATSSLTKDWNKIEVRNKALPVLDNDKIVRVLVTSGHEKGEDTKGQLPVKDWKITLCKPVAGMFDMKKEVLKRMGKSNLQTLPSCSFNRQHHYNHSETGEKDHSASGRLLDISTKLIDRAERRLSQVQTVAEAVTGAILSTEAMELIGNKTPTTALEALSLKHQYEVLAECQFHGVQTDVSVKDRLREIETEIKTWFPETESSYGRIWNTEAQIFDRLLAIYAGHNRFEEECIIRGELSKLHMNIWFDRQHSLIKVFKWPVVKPILRLVGSTPWLLISVAGWILALWILYSLVPSSRGVFDNFAFAYVSFFSVQPPDSYSNMKTVEVLIAFLGMALGFLHLGILISRLYAIMSRK